jgi:hypothetical protein
MRDMSVNQYGVKVSKLLSFENWNWGAELPLEALSRVCEDAARLALSEIFSELTLGIHSDDEGAIVIESDVQLGDEEMALSRPLSDSLDEFLDDRTNRDGSPLEDGREAEGVRALIAILERATVKARSILPSASP